MEKGMEAKSTGEPSYQLQRKVMELPEWIWAALDAIARETQRGKEKRLWNKSTVAAIMLSVEILRHQGTTKPDRERTPYGLGP